MVTYTTIKYRVLVNGALIEDKDTYFKAQLWVLSHVPDDANVVIQKIITKKQTLFERNV